MAFMGMPPDMQLADSQLPGGVYYGSMPGSVPQQSTAPASSQQTMPMQQQQIYNYLFPNGQNAAPGAGSFDPTGANINTAYNGPMQANPLQPNYMGTPVQGQSTSFAGAQLGQGISPQLLAQFGGQNILNQLGGQGLAGQLGPQAAEQQLYNAFAPAQATATRSLNDTLAAMGLSGGPAIQAQTNLQQQLSSGLGQSLAGLIQGGQGNLLNLYGQNAGILNQGNSNQLGLLNTQAGLNQQTGLSNQAAANQMTQQNLSNLYNTNQYNATAGNDANNAYTQALLASYNQNQNNFNNLNQTGYQGATNLAGSAMTGSQNLAGQVVNNFPVYGGVSGAFSNLGSAMGHAGGNAGGAQQGLGYQPQSFAGI